MHGSIAKKLLYKDTDSPYYCFELPPALKDTFSGPQLHTALPAGKQPVIPLALLFAKDSSVLKKWIPKIMPLLLPDAKLWTAYPKLSSGMETDLTRDEGWEPLTAAGLRPVAQVALDDCWSAVRFRSAEAAEAGRKKTALAAIPGVDMQNRIITPPKDLQALLKQHKAAADLFASLSFTNKKEYVVWIESAKQEATREKRVKATLEKLLAGKKNPAEK